MLDATDPIACNRYLPLDASRFDHSYGRDFARDVELGRIRGEVIRHCPAVPHDLVGLVVDDVMAGRKTRW